MAAYSLGLSVLQNKISQNNTGAKHIAYADDLVGAGKLQEIKNLWDEICKHGPPLGYNPNATKSCLIVKEEMNDLATDIFKGYWYHDNNRRPKTFRGSYWVPRIQENFCKELG